MNAILYLKARNLIPVEAQCHNGEVLHAKIWWGPVARRVAGEDDWPVFDNRYRIELIGCSGPTLHKADNKISGLSKLLPLPSAHENITPYDDTGLNILEHSTNTLILRNR